MSRQKKSGVPGAKSGQGNARHSGAKSGPKRGGVLIYGLHAARAAIANPKRKIRSVLATTNAAERMGDVLAARGVSPRIVRPDDLAARVGTGAVHQGVVVEADPLPPRDIASFDAFSVIIVLDQVTDPQNVGAILRSAAAFGADGLVMTARHSPPLEGALAKAASGGLEHVPVALITNLARGLEELGDLGVMRIGLDSAGDQVFEDLPAFQRLALVLGAEDKGLRRLTREHCDVVSALAAPGAIQSLNVSNAAAIALHHAWLTRRARN
ncbi:TrmH family RNA methyltransferase [Dichotomicrobium thermohalophilum]|uniref:23S rRNA (Guanosine2251-2'-O)-methyltransferase n=1 Tax=Dichotomicrobium thermohalophilum TaxID=933063 RepID=A0A397Q6W8_9HYPH|nr:RNA methyltransferase [Dichotomicrobium thermohalophilum]RIA55277.1 23S rRNA (guanosine2251-2'-O)-methyltransferase [Dichotomicrobium thermohalophilum]